MTQKHKVPNNYNQHILKNLSLTVFLGIFVLSNIRLSNGFYCTQKFCDEYTASYSSPCPDVRNCSRIGFRTFLDPSECNCCQYCFSYLKENDTCSTSSPQKPKEMCGPHLKCVLEKGDPSGKAFCRKITTGPGEMNDPNYCMKKLHEYENAAEEGTVGIAQMKPECDSGGWYAPRQCIPGSVCYCSNELGKKIFGLALPSGYQDCACSRDIDRLTRFGFTGKYPHCLPNGDYDELQCVVRTCYCRSHPETVHAIHDMNKLPCYNPSIHVFEPSATRYYIKECELRRAEIEVKIADDELRGIKTIVADTPKCDPDGNYAPIQAHPDDPGRLICAHASNRSQIENFGAKKFSLAAKTMDCNCARARALLSNSATGKPKCCSNGNYKPIQCSGSMCYCVDRYGRQNWELGEVHKDDKDELKCPKGDPSNPNDCDYTYDYGGESSVQMTKAYF